MKDLIAAVLVLMTMATAALADSCWWHNGSLMRLKAYGAERYFYYEQPRDGLWSAGVRPGTLLFNGRKNGNWYSGTARVFSSACGPMEYAVAGPVAPNQTQVTVQGSRQTRSGCAFTGNVVTDTLVFTYSHQC
ncbi:hypothetical protein P1J78_17800 [Psychromarinibacter sp. C21-152]|uniref:Prepilin-type processing-associated H-X9-DG domain-containing protein n=1 Tax=Psychromarinibacter sediminicola TaxID=3033385 RepID=A0AAE3NV51_9RHOB|nr:hypothetical protein [Psychromarinibacter sediminicola]MDF0602596.1 hypothetical protein [Psychromarinibacter sediminicola]